MRVVMKRFIHQDTRQIEKGFVLPTLLIIATSLMIVGAAVLQATFSVKSAVDAQFYNQLAREAAEAGIVYAQSCAEETGVAEWSDASPLTPDVECDGDATGEHAFIIADFDFNYRTTFRVTSDVDESGDRVIISRGTTELIRPWKLGQAHADREAYRAFNETLVEASGATSQTVMAGGTAVNTTGGGAASNSPGTAYSSGTDAINIGTVVDATAMMYMQGYNNVPYATGANTDGKLGDGSSTDRSELGEFNLPEGVSARKTVTAGENAFVLASNGQVYGAGNNEEGQLGNGTTTSTAASDPVRFNLPAGIIAVDLAAGGAGAGAYTVVVGSDGHVYGAGINNYNQLRFSGDSFSSPTQMVQPDDQRVKKVAVVNGANNNQSTVAITESGDVFGRGRNNNRQLGGSSTSNQTSWTKMDLPGDRRAVDVQTGYYNSYLRTADGKVYGFGRGTAGQLGNGSTTTSNPTAQEFNIGSLNARKLAVASSSAVAETGSIGQNGAYVLASDNQVYGAGQNHVGQLGDGSTTNRSTPVKLQLPGSLTAQDVKTMYFTACVLASDRQVYCVGDNKYGQLAQGDTNDRSTAVQFPLPGGVIAVDFAVGYATVHVIGSDGQIYTAGRNNAGQLGVGDTTQRETPATVIAPVTELERIPRMTSIARAWTSILASDGTVWGTGQNQEGQLGNGTTAAQQTTPTLFQLPSGYARDVRGGAWATRVLSSNGQLYGAGQNQTGHLGISSTSDQPNPVQFELPNDLTVRDYTISTSPGEAVTQVLASDNLVYGVGKNGQGQLGIGSTSQVNVPSTTNRFKLPSGVTAKRVFFGDGGIVNTTFVLGSNNILYAAGLNTTGQLGIGNTTSPITCGSTCPQVQMPSGVVATDVAQGSGGHANYFLGSNGRPYATGTNNNFGQLGDGTATSRSSPVEMTLPSGLRALKIKAATGAWSHSVYVQASNGQLYGAGRNSNGQLGRGTANNSPHPTMEPVQIPSGLSVVDFWVGQENVFILASDGQMYGAGRNDVGQLGTGDTNDKLTATERFQLPSGVVAVDFATQFGITSDAIQPYFSGVMGSDGVLYVAGDNQYGQLGGTDSPVVTPRAYDLPQPSAQPGIIF